MTDQAQPRFSVLVASYNQADYVLATLDTVATQTLDDWELVVVNDGSTDDTAERVQGWMRHHQAERSNRMVMETIPNAGQSAAMEHGYGLCRGEYICLLDSDDLWLPGKLEAVDRATRTDPDAGMIVHPLYVVDSEGRRTGDVRPKRAKLTHGDARAQVRATSRHVAPATSGVVLRSDVFARLLPMPTRRFRTAADLYLTLGGALEAPVHAMDEPLAEYRMHPDGAHIRTMLTADGVRYWVDLQDVIVEHFGLQAAVARNSYFLRHDFALAKLDGSPAAQLRGLGRLARATWGDDSFRAPQRLALIGFWTACLVAPRPLFRRLWRFFQVRQTGFDKIGLARARAGA